MKSLLTSIIVLSLFAYIAAGTFLYLKQRSFIYFPVQYPAGDLKELVFENQGEQIAVSVLNQGQDRALLYFGGNAENVEYNGPDFQQTFPEHTVYLVKYRGYGTSSGKPTEAGLFADALAIYDGITDDHSSMSTMGRSLGSGIAVYLSANRAIDKLILVTPFDSILSIAGKMFPIFPHRLLLKDQYDSISRAGSIRTPTLVVIAERDQVIPRLHSDNLVAAFNPDVVTVEVIPDRGHNDLSSSPEYHQILNRFTK